MELILSTTAKFFENLFEQDPYNRTTISLRLVLMMSSRSMYLLKQLRCSMAKSVY